ncbi:hypothetical protein MPSEU_000592600 [Mayamaea pseudoterrestris]|nr:hypothetical protein MPSEU_000592600 [Mayamaea pseudoterrestris]
MTTIGANLLLTQNEIYNQLYSIGGPLAVIFLISFWISNFFMEYDMAIATILQCFIADEDMFNGDECYAEAGLKRNIIVIEHQNEYSLLTASMSQTILCIFLLQALQNWQYITQRLNATSSCQLRGICTKRTRRRNDRYTVTRTTDARCFATALMDQNATISNPLEDSLENGAEYTPVEQLLQLTRQRPMNEAAVRQSKQLLETILESDSVPVTERLQLLNHTLDAWKISMERQRREEKDSTQALLNVSNLSHQVCDWIKNQWIQGQLNNHDEDIQATFAILLSLMSKVTPNRSLAASNVRVILNKMPISPNLVVWNAALTVLAKWKAPGEAWELFQSMKQETSIVPDIVSYSCVLESLIHEQAYGFAVIKAQGLLQSLQETTASPNSIIYFHYLRILIADNQLDVALDTLQELSRNYLDDPSTKALPDQQMFAAVMTACAKSGDCDRTKQLLELLCALYRTSSFSPEFCLQPTSLTNILNALYASNGNKQDVAQTMIHIVKVCRELAFDADVDESSSQHFASFHPRTNHYNRVMEAWANLAQNDAQAVDYVEELLQQMKDNFHATSQPNKLSYTTLMKALTRCKNVRAADRCLGILQEMWESTDQSLNSNARPDVYVYNIAILAWSQAAKRDAKAALQAEALYQDLKTRFDNGDELLEPTEATYVALMTAWNNMARMSSGDNQKAAERCKFYFNQAQAQQCVLTVRLYTAMLDSLKELGDAKQADKLFQQMIDDVKGGNSKAMPTIETLHTLMTTWARSQSRDAPLKAEAMLELMTQLYEDQNLTLKPDVTTYNVVLNCWAKSKRKEAPIRAQEIVKLMEEKCIFGLGDSASICPDATTYSTVLDAWSRSRRKDAPQRALEYLNKLDERHRGGEKMCRLTPFHFATVMNVFAAHGDPDGIEKLMNQMEDTGMGPTTYCYNALLKALVQSKAVNANTRSEEILRKMQALGSRESKPDVATYTICFSALELNPNDETWDRAQSLLADCLSQAGPTVATFLAYLRVLSRSNTPNKAKKAHKVLAQMKKLGIPTTRHIWHEIEKCRDTTDESWVDQRQRARTN